MTPWMSSLGVVAVISALPLICIALFARRPDKLQRSVGRLVPLAAGALAGAPLFHLMPEAMASGIGAGAVAVWMGVGATAFYLLDRILHARVTPLALPASGALVSTGSSGLRALLPLLVVGDALHNAVDGVLIAGAYLDEPTLGIVTGVAIALHELPRELGTVALLLAAGMGMRQAIGLNVATSLLAAASAVATLVAGSGVIASSGAVLAIGAGTFFYLAGALVMTELRGPGSRADVPLRAVLFVAGLLLTTLGRHTH